MEVIKKPINKGSMMNTIYKFYIDKAVKEGIHLNDMHTQTNKPIFDTLLNPQYTSK
jgi:hypothetical protein